MLKAQAELKAQIEELLNKAKALDQAEKNQAQVDLVGQIKRREDWLKVIAQAKARLEQQRQREADKARARSQGDERKPRNKNGKPKGGRYKRDFGVPQANAQESCHRQ